MGVNGQRQTNVVGLKPRDRRPWAFALLALSSAAGCVESPPALPVVARPELGASHNPAACGTVVGRVTWAGPVPVVPPLLGAVPDGDGYRWVNPANPFDPAVDAPTGGLAGALIHLTGVEPAASRPWDVPAVAVELRDYAYNLRAAVVRTGDAVTVTSRDPELHAARGRGAGFFTLPLPVPGRPTARVLPTPGVVELTSGAGYFWMAADLLVTDTPYAGVTAADGTLMLPGVPAGAYTVTCRVRDWHVTATERDPETGLVFRQSYAPPVVVPRRVTVTAGGTAAVEWSFSSAQFRP